jgi:hypothetical protein
MNSKDINRTRAYGFGVVYRLFNLPPGHPFSITNRIVETSQNVPDVARAITKILGRETFELLIFFESRLGFAGRYRNVVDAVTDALHNTGVVIQFASDKECRLLKTLEDRVSTYRDVPGINDMASSVSAAVAINSSKLAEASSQKQSWEGYLLKAAIYERRFVSFREPFPHDPERYGDRLLETVKTWSGALDASVIISVPNGSKAYCFLIFVKSANPTRAGLLAISKFVSSELFEDECWGSHVLGQGHLNDWKGIGEEWDSRVVKRGCGVTIDWPVLSSATVPYGYDEHFKHDSTPRDRARLRAAMELETVKKIMSDPDASTEIVKYDISKERFDEAVNIISIRKESEILKRRAEAAETEMRARDVENSFRVEELYHAILEMETRAKRS